MIAAEEEEVHGLPWTRKTFLKKWATKSAQTVNSPEYK